MVPSRIVVLGAMPVDHNGKVDRKALLAIPLPERGEIVREGAARAQSREVQLLTTLWKDALGVGDVGPADNFFDLGGNSLTAVRVLSGIREHLAVEVPLHQLYACPTIAEQAKLIRAVSRAMPLQAKERTSVFSVLGALALADDVRPVHGDDVRDVLLTGATGFVGAHLLGNLLAETDATVYCLVRAGNKDDAIRRIAETLRYYGLHRDDTMKRVIALPGNPGLPRFGLDTSA